MRDFNDQARPPPAASTDHQKELVRLVTGLSHRHSPWQVFSDFVEMGAVSFSNAIDLAQRDKREERYMDIIKRYKLDELQKFPQMLVALTLALEIEPADILGRTFHDLELHNKWAGQFFSPYHLGRMMAKLTLSDNVQARIEERGFVTAQEPAVGSGAMVIALAHEMRELGINYQQHLHVTAIDVDPKCVHMAYLQFSLLHIPAIIIHGNALSLEENGHWYTPAHIMGGWNAKLRRQATATETYEIHGAPMPQPQTAQHSEDPPAPGQLTLF